MNRNQLDFEKPLIELREKIAELKTFTKSESIDFSEEILSLENKAKSLEKEIYQNLTVWQKVQVSRHPLRPTTKTYIKNIFSEFIELHGDRNFGDDQAIIGGIGLLEGIPVTVIGHERGVGTKDKISCNFGLPHPEGYRKALRLMKQADKFSRPIITFIDTQGAYPGVEAEKRGQSEAIARNLKEMFSFTVPIICVITGEGGSGGALGIGVGNKLLMLENAYYSVISPEGAASILWRDASKAQVAAEALKITAAHLLEKNIIDEIIPEPRGGAHNDPTFQFGVVKKSILCHLRQLMKLSPDELLLQRSDKYMNIGEFDIEEVNSLDD